MRRFTRSSPALRDATDGLIGRARSVRATWHRIAREIPRVTAAAAALAALAALALPAATFESATMLWLDALAVVLIAGALYAAADARHNWLTPLPSILAVAATAVAGLAEPSPAGVLVGLVAVLIAAHLVLLDLVAGRTPLRGIRAEAGALLAAIAATGLTVLVAQLPPLEWLWLVGVGLAAATAAYVMVIGPRR